MKIYIQSKSGNFNSTFSLSGGDEIAAFEWLRRTGHYLAKYADQTIVVPFEQIEYVRRASDDE